MTVMYDDDTPVINDLRYHEDSNRSQQISKR